MSFLIVKLPPVRGLKKQLMELFDNEVQLQTDFMTQLTNKRDMDVCLWSCIIEKGKHTKKWCVCKLCHRDVNIECDDSIENDENGKCMDCKKLGVSLWLLCIHMKILHKC